MTANDVDSPACLELVERIFGCVNHADLELVERGIDKHAFTPMALRALETCLYEAHCQISATLDRAERILKNCKPNPAVRKRMGYPAARALAQELSVMMHAEALRVCREHVAHENIAAE